jgi:hypothetical protein
VDEIVSDIISNYVNKGLNGEVANSGFNYTTLLETFSDVIPYISFPYKTALASSNDLIDLETALKAGNPSCHWIVTTDNIFHLKSLNASQTGWTKYYGGDDNTAGQATLTYGVDYFHINLEKMGAECNYVLYYGAWRRPSNGDLWTENAHSLWSKTEGTTTIDDYTTKKIVNANSVRARNNSGNPSAPITIAYPSAKNAVWDFSGFTDFNTPTLNFYVYYDLTLTTTLRVRLYTDSSNYYSLTITPTNQTWQHYSIPVGPYFNVQANNTTAWTPTTTGSLNWNNINYVEFYVSNAEMYNAGGDRYFFAVDGLHFGGANISRVAWNSDLPGGTLKMQLITDDVGKDDSLKASDTTGLRAQLAYSALLRLQKPSTVGTVETPMIKDALPGQLFSIQGTDYRVTKIIQSISKDGYQSQPSLTDDVTNGRARVRYEDINKIYAAIRPEWQDTQSSSIKAGTVDWRIARLIKDYA